MTRGFFLFLSRSQRIRKWMETAGAARKLTARFVAGETLGQELEVCARLQQQGILSTLDHLGENVTALEQAAEARDVYRDALERIHAGGLASTISLKLTQMGLDLSPAACVENVSALAQQAARFQTRVEIDMESTAYTDRILRVVERVSRDSGSVRAVIQAYLYRSAGDIERLNQLGVPVRLCKGAYKEPHNEAFAHKKDVDANYLKLLKLLLDRGVDPAIATHDPNMQSATLAYARERGLGPEKFEFQMLYGIRRDLQQALAAAGYRLRLYVPYGTEWYPYFMRRLAERPANLFFLARNFFR